MLAEAITLNGDELFLVLVIVLVAVIVAVVVVALGFILAAKAARGSRTAMSWWTVVLVLEGLTWFKWAPGLFRSNSPWTALIIPAIVAGQVGLFLLVRE